MSFIRFLKRCLWLVLVGTMIAFHNVYRQEFKAKDPVEVVIIEDEEE